MLEAETPCGSNPSIPCDYLSHSASTLLSNNLILDASWNIGCSVNILHVKYLYTLFTIMKLRFTCCEPIFARWRSFIADFPMALLIIGFLSKNWISCIFSENWPFVLLAWPLCDYGWVQVPAGRHDKRVFDLDNHPGVVIKPWPGRCFSY